MFVKWLNLFLKSNESFNHPFKLICDAQNKPFLVSSSLKELCINMFQQQCLFAPYDELWQEKLTFLIEFQAWFRIESDLSLDTEFGLLFLKCSLSSANSSCIEWTISILYDLQIYMLNWQNNNLLHLLEYRNCKQYFNPSNQFSSFIIQKTCIKALGGTTNVLWKYGAYTFSTALHVITFIEQRSRTVKHTSKP